MKHEDLNIMFNELIDIKDSLDKYLIGLDDREFSNFHDIWVIRRVRINWMIATLDDELRNWD